MWLCQIWFYCFAVGLFVIQLYLVSWIFKLKKVNKALSKLQYVEFLILILDTYEKLKYGSDLGCERKFCFFKLRNCKHGVAVYQEGEDWVEWIWGRQSLAGAWGTFYAVCGHKCCLGSCIYDSEVKRRPLGYIKFACFWHVDGIASHKTKWNHRNDMNRGAKLWDWARDTPGQWGFGDEEPTEEKEQLLNRSKFESSILKAKRRASQGWENKASTEEKGVGWIRHEGAVLVVQGLGIRLPGPRTRVRALAGDWDPTCWRAAKPVSHNSRGDWQHNRRCHVLQLRPSATKESLEKKQRHEEIWGIDRCAHYLDCGMVLQVYMYPSHMLHVTHMQFLYHLFLNKWSCSVVSDSLWPHGLSMGFSRQEYWSRLPFPSPGDLPHPGTEPGSPTTMLYHLSHQRSPISQ